MDLIITAATGYAVAQLVPFLDSVEHSFDQIKVIMIAYKKDGKVIRTLKNKYPFLEFVTVYKKSKLATKILRIVNSRISENHHYPNNPLLRLLSRHFLHIALERYFIALNILRDYNNSISNVLLTDSRDVLIQQNPFTFTDGGLISGLEAKTMLIKSCAINSAWIKSIYGEEGLNKIGDRHIICSGVTMGSTQAIKNYLVEMCKEIDNHLPNAASSDGTDQGIHNYLIGTNRVLVRTVDNKSGVIATLGYEKPTAISKNSKTGLIKVYDSYPAIVHQYDRHSKITDAY